MGLFEGRSRVKRATTAPLGNLTMDAYIHNNRLGKRNHKATVEDQADTDGELPADRRARLERLPGFPPNSLRGLRKRRHTSDGLDASSPAPGGAESPVNGYFCNGGRDTPPPAGNSGHHNHHRKRLTEAQKLMISSDCHKTEIFTTKLRHVPGRLSAAGAGLPPVLQRNGAPGVGRPRRRSQPRRRTSSSSSFSSCDELPLARLPHLPQTSNGKKRQTLDSLLLRDNEQYYKVEILSSKLRSNRPLSEGPGEEESDGPPHLEPEAPVAVKPPPPEINGFPEDSCDSFRVVSRTPSSGRRAVRRPVGKHCGTPHGCAPRPPPPPPRRVRHASSSDTSSEDEPAAAQTDRGPLNAELLAPAENLAFTFEALPSSEEWYRTYERQNLGDAVVEALSEPLETAAVRLPYQMSQEELFPSQPPTPPPAPASQTNGAGGSRGAKHRRLSQLAAAASASADAGYRKSPRCHASTRAARCSVDAAEGVATWDCSLEQLQLVAASISSLLTAAQEQADGLAPGGGGGGPAAGRQQRRGRRRTASGAEPAHLAGLSDPQPPDLAALLRQADPPPSQQPTPAASAQDDTASVTTDCTSVSSGSAPGTSRRRAVKRRKNLTGWPRDRNRSKKSKLLKAAVKRAAAAAAASSGAGSSAAGSTGRRRSR